VDLFDELINELSRHDIMQTLLKVPLDLPDFVFRTHFPYSSCIVPAYQYHLPPSVWDSLDFYSRLDIDTLFFVFYYMEVGQSILPVLFSRW